MNSRLVTLQRFVVCVYNGVKRPVYENEIKTEGMEICLKLLLIVKCPFQFDRDSNTCTFYHPALYLQENTEWHLHQ